MLEKIGHSRPQKQLKLQLFLVTGISASTWTCTVLIATLPATAQISGDGSLGTLVNDSPTDSCLSALCTITGGTINEASSTLLHSFDQFTSPENAPSPSALFVDPGVRDIIVRVTGGSQSFLNGELSTSAGSTANLFFVNPSGITFGSNAQLNVGGSFVASTASEIIFKNDISLATGSATPANSELLSISTPVGLGFLPNNASAPISVQGTGNRLTFGSPDNPRSQFVNRIFQQPLPPEAPFPPLPPISELAVRPEQTLSLVANGIELNGGNLTSLGGQVELGSIATGTALISEDLSLDYSQVSQFADILLTNRSTVEVSASRSGGIQLSGRDIGLSDGSALLAETLPIPPFPPSAESSSPGTIDIAATGEVEVSGFVAEPAVPFNPPFFTYLSVDAVPGSTSSGGSLSIQASNLSVKDGGQISAATFGSGDGGQISINTENAVALVGGSPSGPSGLFAIADSISSGNSGQISVETGELRMSQGSTILTSSLASGTAGPIEIIANRLDVIGTSEPVEVLKPDGLVLTSVPTGIRSDMSVASIGKGNPIRLEIGELLISEGGEIETVTLGAGESGDIEIIARGIIVSGETPLGAEGPSSLSTLVDPRAIGNGGALIIKTDSLQILESAQVSTTTAGSGRAGDLLVESESVLISGQNLFGRSGLFSNAINSTGAGGNLSVDTETLRIEDGGTLNVSNFPSGANSPFPPGQGDAGNLQIQARQISLNGGGLISADTAAGDRGNINLQTETLTLRRSSRITANATSTAIGGNIDIDAPNGFIVAVPTENSDITANAVFGDGGRIDITAQSILGIEPRPNLTPLSDITTSSEFGIDGETQIETLETEVRTENTPLPQSTDIPLVAQGCSATGSTDSRFVQSGRSGISNSPYGQLNGRDSLADVSLPSSLAASQPEKTSQDAAPEATANLNEADSQETRTIPSSEAIAEAKSWATNAQGEVVLFSAESSEVDKCLS